MGQIKEYIKIAILNIKHNRGRSILTMLGIIIGISSVIMVLSIGNGVRSQISGELEGMAGGQVDVYVDQSRKDTTVNFNLDDCDAIVNNVEHVKGVTPIMGAWGTVEGPKADSDVRLIGGTVGLEYYNTEPLSRGRYFTQGDYDAGSAVCIIREADAKMLFGTSDVVGMPLEVTIWGLSTELTVIGVREDSAASLISMVQGGGFVDAEVPMTVMADKFGYYIDEMSEVMIFSEKAEYSSEVAANTKRLLESRHHCIGENQILIQSFEDATAGIGTVLGIITGFVSLVAAISLLVGGIGVMNIMLVSVTERTREIGIRKALGARTKSIMMQFLAEAGIITLIGGLIGIILGIFNAFVICAVASIDFAISFVTILIATIFSCGVGLFFGIYPAKKAAALSPIEALRHE